MDVLKDCKDCFMKIDFERSGFLEPLDGSFT